MNQNGKQDVVFRMPNTGGRPLAQLIGLPAKVSSELQGVFRSKVLDIVADNNEVRQTSEILAPKMKKYLKSESVDMDTIETLGLHYKKKKTHRDDSHSVQRGNLSNELRVFKPTDEEQEIRRRYQNMNREQLLRAKKLYYTICTAEINLLLNTSETANPDFQFEECIVQITEELNAERHAEKHAAMQRPPRGDSQDQNDGVDLA